MAARMIAPVRRKPTLTPEQNEILLRILSFAERPQFASKRPCSSRLAD
jgi:hypothetical protein